MCNRQDIHPYLRKAENVEVVVDTSTTTINLLSNALENELERNKKLQRIIMDLDIALEQLLVTPNKATRAEARRVLDRVKE